MAWNLVHSFNIGMVIGLLLAKNGIKAKDVKVVLSTAMSDVWH